MTPPSPRPLIGLTCYTTQAEDWVEHAPGHYLDFVFRDYSRAVDSAGGIPVLLPVLEDLETARAAVARLDGLFLTGGHDVSPRLFGEEPEVGLGEMDYERDVMEVEAVREAEKRRLPILGICRGIQLLAAAFGGRLYQDIFRQVSGCLDHKQKASKRVNTHRVNLAPGSRLLEIVGTETLWVNSNHHQAVKEVPPGFVVTAEASDGLVEAIERPDYPFLVGLQWHPEGTWVRDEASRKIFAALVAAARARMSESAGVPGSGSERAGGQKERG